MPNSDYPDLICIHIHLAILSLSKYTPRASWQVCSLSAVLFTGITIVSGMSLSTHGPRRWNHGSSDGLFLPISINFITFEKSHLT